MNLWAAEGISSERLEEISREIIVSEFDWRFGSTSQEDGIGFSLIDFKVDDETFSPRQLLGVDLELWWKENRIQRSIALLVDSSDSWESGYARRLRTLLRSNSGILLFEEGNDTITDALDSGYWIAEGKTSREEGDILWVEDFRGDPIARLVVVDSFTFEGEGRSRDVVELEPLWATRPIVAGMGLLSKKEITTSIGFPLSLDRVGVGITLELPIPGSLFGFSAQMEADRHLYDQQYELTAGIGLFRRIALGTFSNKATSLGRWWTNIQLTAGMGMQGGAVFQDASTVRFLYGGEVYLGIGHQSTAHWYWGVTAGYRYRALTEGGVADSVQSNEAGITLSPTLLWVW